MIRLHLPTLALPLPNSLCSTLLRWRIFWLGLEADIPMKEWLTSSITGAHNKQTKESSFENQGNPGPCLMLCERCWWKNFSMHTFIGIQARECFHILWEKRDQEEGSTFAQVFSFFSLTKIVSYILDKIKVTLFSTNLLVFFILSTNSYSWKVPENLQLSAFLSY